MISVNDGQGNRLQEISTANFDIVRSDKTLSNKYYVLKAPKKLVDIEKNKLDTNKKKIIELEFQYKK